MLVYKVVDIENNDLVVKRVRRIRKTHGLEETTSFNGKVLDSFLFGNDKVGYGPVLVYVHLMTDGKNTFVVYDIEDMLKETKADKLAWVDGTESRVIFK